MNRQKRKQIAETTLQILERKEYNGINIESDINYTNENTILFMPDDFQHLELPLPQKTTNFEVISCSTLEASEMYPGSAVLNFASAKNPGGGFLGGSQSQEETLARSSALYSSLLTKPEYYEQHKMLRNPLYTHRLIYSPDTIVFRKDSGEFLENPYKVSFITAPAPNYGAIEKNRPQDIEKIEMTMKERMNNILTVAALKQHKIVILGAYGCGVFRNPPEMVARSFKEVIQKNFMGYFEKIVFAIYDTTKNQSVLQTFQSTFNDLI
eukprot:TRINITY_DN321_c0_g1_i1.p1 TRINITY_DN321_c0_g1~~TRINITY_DN321_c0_g1_i1.p1  ORF type:complete len:267 (+),score=73.71 TRINITY_DN321_c0_g1_i1:55-855(+)